MVVDGAQAVTCTRCLRHANNNGAVSVQENFLLELPHGVASALAHDVNTELRRRRTRLGVSSQASLHHALAVVIRLHDQKVQSIDGGRTGLCATGEFILEPGALHAAALKSLEHSLVHDWLPDDIQAKVALQDMKQKDRRHMSPGQSVTIRMQLQRVASWIDDTPDEAELSLSRSQRGNRSLRMVATDSRWQPIVQDGIKQDSVRSDALSGSLLGLDVMTGLVLEESFSAGLRQETVRSSVRLRNSLDFDVEVCLQHFPAHTCYQSFGYSYLCRFTLDDILTCAFQTVKSVVWLQVSVKVPPGMPLFARLSSVHSSSSLQRSGSLSGAEQLQLRSLAGADVIHGSAGSTSTTEVTQDEVLENERSVPFKGFKSTHLMALDPRRWDILPSLSSHGRAPGVCPFV